MTECTVSECVMNECVMSEFVCVTAPLKNALTLHLSAGNLPGACDHVQRTSLKVGALVYTIVVDIVRFVFIFCVRRE